MSFGFGLSDFALCTKVAFSVYDGLKNGPSECKSFADEIFHLYTVLKGLQDEIEAVCKDDARLALDFFTPPLAHRQPGLTEHGLRCLELLLVDIRGVENLPFPVSEKSSLGFEKGRLAFTLNRGSYRDSSDFLTLSSLEKRFYQARFSRQIPRYREAVADIINKLTAENVLLISYKQGKALQSQQRIEDSQHKLMSKVVESQDRSMSVASAIQESQIRIESQLHQIMKAQIHDPNPLLRGSLDASSPEGRQTWMELGRLMREEGIPPNVIFKNKSLLVQAMRKRLEEIDASPDEASFRTALEYQSFSSAAKHSPSVALGAKDSISLLSSAPSLGATFPSHLMVHQSQTLDCLDDEENVDNGMRSLMSGMEESSESADTSQQFGHEIDLAEG